MKVVGVLIDFDNIFPRPIIEYNEDVIKNVIDSVVQKIKNSIPSIDRFIIRLYGGWYENTSLTARASTLSSYLPSFNNLFPILVPPKTIVQGTVELATQLYGHSFIWYNTYREHEGLPKLRIKQSAIGSRCASNSNNCPVHILKKFVEKKQRVCNIAGCTTVHSSVFFSRTQKYVDTMMACDIITFGTDNDVLGVYVLSDDVDLFPAFAMIHDLKATKAKIGLFITNPQNVAAYESLLKPFDIDVSLIASYNL